ncbi:MAG: crossover junction endodeoxyribonuclease RuvC [Proteobacteria bacterium]|nr:crossover junction endodeoxyribonuclease RuvC [Pseudomonadota bacterium]
MERLYIGIAYAPLAHTALWRYGLSSIRADCLSGIIMATVRILGIDPGSRYMGYAIIEQEGSRLRYVDADRLVLGDAPFTQRLLSIDSFLNGYLEQMQPDEAAFEGIFHQKYADAAIKLGHARGVAIVACARFGMPLFEYSPTDVKQSVTSYGRAEKTQVAAMVRFLLGVRHELPVDATDALAIAICHANRRTAG